MLKRDGYLSDDALEPASIFGSHFASFIHQDDQRPSPTIVAFDILMPKLKIATSVVSAILERLSVHKSVGHNSIHPQLLRTLASFLVELFAFIFSSTLLTGAIAFDWRTDNGDTES